MFGLNGCSCSVNDVRQYLWSGLPMHLYWQFLDSSSIQDLPSSATSNACVLRDGHLLLPPTEQGRITTISVSTGPNPGPRQCPRELWEPELYQEFVDTGNMIDIEAEVEEQLPKLRLSARPVSPSGGYSRTLCCVQVARL